MKDSLEGTGPASSFPGPTPAVLTRKGFIGSEVSLIAPFAQEPHSWFCSGCRSPRFALAPRISV